MHKEEPTLSVICVFRNRKEWIEPTLKALYSIRDIPCEFIIIDDGSTDGSAEAIRSLIEHHQHDQTYFFEQESPRGRGNSLNSALEQVSAPLLWIPESLNSIDQQLLEDAISELEKSGAPMAIAGEEELPESPIDWLQLLQNERLPYDRNYLFHLRKIRPGRKFTDPHWTTRHASEWAIRLHAGADPVSIKPFSKGDTDQLAMDDRSKRECILALLRSPGLSLSGQEKAFRMLRSYGQSDLEEEKGGMDVLFHEALSLFRSGNSVAALELLNRILAAAPEHLRSRSLKIEILEKMRRYVEAAEVKHGYQAHQKEPDGAQLDVSEEDDQGGPDTETSGHPVDAEDSRVDSERGDVDEIDHDVSGSGSDVSEGAAEEQEAKADAKSESESGRESHADEADPAVAEPKKEDANAVTDDFEEPGSDPSHRGKYEKELREQPNVTIIIPTATHRRPILEKCLASVFRFTAPDRTRVIVVNNGSIDDTADCLERLLGRGFPLTVLSNDQNIGFAAAVNQGLAKAGNGFVIVMHNDVVLHRPIPARLAHILEKNPDIGLVTPKSDATWNKAQLAVEPDVGESEAEADASPFTDADFVDGYCMAFRNEPGLTLNKQYGLAYFDDADFCLRIQKKGFRVVIAGQEQVEHVGGLTTGDLGLSMRSKGYWKNASLFHKEWNIAPRFPARNTENDPIRQFVLLGEIINPFFPEEHLLEYFHDLFTSEQKTRVLNSEFPPDALTSMLRLMMAANQREVLRRLEQQLDALPPDIPLYHDLVTFYYDRTIYSRCKLYIDKLEAADSKLPTDFALYRLKIAIGEKDYASASLHLQKLMDHIPTHPEVLLAAAEIHRRNGNRDESSQFISLARSFNPYIKSLFNAK